MKMQVSLSNGQEHLELKEFICCLQFLEIIMIITIRTVKSKLPFLCSMRILDTEDFGIK